MESKTRVLIVEDDMIIAANMSLQLSKLGYEVTGIETRGEEALTHAKLNTPDVVLMDINLKGSIDGIETAYSIQTTTDIPIVYITANNDEATFEKARKTHPFAFIAKPINMRALHRTLSLVEEQLNNRNREKEETEEIIEILNDRIFIRHHGQMIKLLFNEILFIEADRNYCHIVTPKQVYLLTATLKVMQDKLPGSIFVRVHRSYIVNITQLDVVAESHVEINRKVIPLSKSYKETLLKHLQTI
ncbi:MAG: response regulator [Eudoraea sp.]|nr:response regulator [Eudoraea sp.]